MAEGERSPWCALSDGGVKAKMLRDADGDGMPDWWEKQEGLNPRDAADGSRVVSKEGYTKLERYLNSFSQMSGMKVALMDRRFHGIMVCGYDAGAVES